MTYIEPHFCTYKTDSGVIFETARRASSIPLIKEVVQMTRPRLIIELGTARAGLTAIFRDVAPHAFIRSFDIRKAPQLTDEQVAIFDGRVSFIQADVFKEGKGVVLNYLAWNNRKLLYCDGGDKTKEVMLFAQYLGKKDVLGVHDWTDGNPPTDAHAKVLRPWLKEHGFIPCKQEEFERVDCTSRFWIREAK